MPNPRENFPRINHLNEYLDYDIKKEKFIVLVDAIPVTRKEFSFDDMIRTTNIEKREELKKLMMEFCKFEWAKITKGTNSNMRNRIENALMSGIGLIDAIRFMDTDKNPRYESLVPRRKKREI
jgi:hypothetical protein